MDKAKRKAIEKSVVELGGEWRDVDFCHLFKINCGSGYRFTDSGNCTLGGEYVCTRAEFEQVKAEMQNKPSWKDAPEWAEWLAQDADGKWWWFIDKPTLQRITWDVVTICRMRSHGYGRTIGDWRNTLEKRPEVTYKNSELDLHGLHIEQKSTNTLPWSEYNDHQKIAEPVDIGACWDNEDTDLHSLDFAIESTAELIDQVANQEAVDKLQTELDRLLDFRREVLGWRPPKN